MLATDKAVLLAKRDQEIINDVFSSNLLKDLITPVRSKFSGHPHRLILDADEIRILYQALCFYCEYNSYSFAKIDVFKLLMLLKDKSELSEQTTFRLD